MHDYQSCLVPFNFGDVMGHVLHEVHTQLFCRPAKHRREALRIWCMMTWRLAKAPLAVQLEAAKYCCHRGDSKKRASQLLILHGDPVARHRLLEHLQVGDGDVVQYSVGVSRGD